MILHLKPGPKSQEFMHTKLVKFIEGVNLLVGPNGSGKSSVLNAISSAAKWSKSEWKGRRRFLKVRGEVVTRFFDTERMNPRTMGMDSALEMGVGALQLKFASRTRSHGQTLGPLLGLGMRNEIKKVQRSKLPRAKLVMLIDEPESGLDQASLAAFADVVNTWKSKVQFIIATHSVWLWCKLNGNLIILGEDKEYVSNTIRVWRRALLVGSQI